MSKKRIPASELYLVDKGLKAMVALRTAASYKTESRSTWTSRGEPLMKFK